jgi:DUF1680 family protein
LKLKQETDYPWDGYIKISIQQTPDKKYSIFLRIPGWSSNASIKINGKEEMSMNKVKYYELNRKWNKGDVIEISFPMEVKLMESNPLVEETRNQVAVMRGPVVYCLESPDMPNKMNVFDIGLTLSNNFKPVKKTINHQEIVFLEGSAIATNTSRWENKLYRQIYPEGGAIQIDLIPYFAWNNRGPSEMTVWMPFKR